MDNRANIIEISSVNSTNIYASELLKNHVLAEGTIIWTKSQRQGRGQRGNNWHSEDNQNITCSIIISPDFLPIEKQFYLSILTSVSIIDFLKDKVPVTSIKWPNDIYYKDLKLGGILVENTICGSAFTNSIIGIGLNINQKKFPAEIPNPVSLTNICNQEFDLKTLIIELSGCFYRNYEKLRAGKWEILKKEYMKNLYLFGKKESYKDSEGVFTGTIVDVLDTGELVIADEFKNKRYYLFKEVEFVKA